MSGQFLTCKDCEGVSLFESDEVEKAWAILFANKEKTFTIVQFAPSVRVTLGEKFGMQSGEDGIGKIVTVLRDMGADLVVDTAIAEDVVTLSEMKRLKARRYFGEKAPLFASKCPAWVEYAREKYEGIEISPLPSASAVSGALLKEYYKKQTGKTVRVLSVEPCEKKGNTFGVDASVTVEDFADMLSEVEQVGTSVRLLKKQPLDMPFGCASGSGYITEASGGVAEAVARCLIEDKSAEAFQKFAYSGFYGNKARREAVLALGGEVWRFAVVCGFKAAEELIEEINSGEAQYDYVEVLACDCGCVSGEGLGFDDEGKVEEEMVRRLRWQGLKNLDMKSAVRSADKSLAAMALEKKWESWLQKKAAGLIEDDGEIEPVELTEGWEEPVAPVEEKPIEEVVEETPVDNVVEEVEERAEIIEEVIVEEEPMEEILEEVIEEVIEETPVEEEICVVEEEIVEETVEEEVPVEEEIVEETVEEEVSIVEEIVEEMVEEEVSVEEEIVEETVEEEVSVEEEIVEETVEEEVSLEEEIVEETDEEEVSLEEEIVEETDEEEVPVEEEIVEETVEEDFDEEEEESIEETMEEVSVEKPKTSIPNHAKASKGKKKSRKDIRKLRRQKRRNK